MKFYCYMYIISMQAMHYMCTLYFTNFIYIYTCSAKQLSSINKPFSTFDYIKLFFIGYI